MELREFETFMNMKSVCALQQRHIKDHMELTHLQMKLVDQLVLSKSISGIQQQHHHLREMTTTISDQSPVENWLKQLS